MQNPITSAEAVVRARRDEVAKNDDGFTLIELLVVIAVIGILAAIVVFGVANFRGDATDAACQAQQTTAQTAADAYMAKTGAASPVAIGSLTANDPTSGQPYLRLPAGSTLGTAACAYPSNVKA